MEGSGQKRAWSPGSINREKKEPAGDELLGAWEAGVLQVGSWQCPPSQPLSRAGLEVGRGGESGTEAGKAGQEGFLPLWACEWFRLPT